MRGEGPSWRARAIVFSNRCSPDWDGSGPSRDDGKILGQGGSGRSVNAEDEVVRRK